MGATLSSPVFDAVRVRRRDWGGDVSDTVGGDVLEKKKKKKEEKEEKERTR